ncbi:SDR family NAD(P)-dependent oxidoreductase [Ensifer soli]|uniref:SDR family NAD(P)-dependent oxidoreductase n=1 Tax=Ciceribacter sp. sgz301302 TaxID=3342379 RepID=UPI0035BC3A81
MRLKDRVVLVTGASRGIGLGIVERFAEEGAVVVAASSRPEGCAYPAGVEAIRLDVSSEEDWRDAVGTVLSTHGRIDALVNNAGIISYEPLDTLSLAEWSRIVAVNQTGVFLGMRAVVEPMKRAGRGAIVNISSIWGNASVSGAHAYHATKGAVRNMTKNAAITYAPFGIRVNSVHPGFIATPLTDSQPADLNRVVIEATPMKRAGTPREIAHGCLFLVSDESSFMTGSELVIDGGYLAQ